MKVRGFMDDWLPPLDIEAESEGVLHARASFPPDSPWFDGHFPQGPLLPGVALMALVYRLAAEDWLRRGVTPRLWAFKKVKFKNLVAPGDGLTARVRRVDASGRYEAKVEMGGETVFTGSFWVADAEAGS
jgi:3-hydroxyacyl-[acyl-carrier-protein] dehydratase